ncbi:MAG: peptidylprolyl isomerase [Erysipelotrichales bacterium]|nr:peptidylprolyl isomerase [Erysipelotrichales bacterium]
MKGKQINGLILASLLVLSGCSTTVKENGKDIIASIDGIKISADDVYDIFSSKYVGQVSMFNYILKQLINENFPINDAMKKEAQDTIDTIVTNYKNQYGDDYESYLEKDLSSVEQYQNIDEYKQSLIDNLQYAEFKKKYVKENFDTVFEDYYKVEKPRMMSIIKIAVEDMENPTDEEKEKLKEVKELLKTDKSFEDIAKGYSDDVSRSANGYIGIVDSTLGLYNTYGDDVEKKAFSLKEGEISDEIKGNDGYYFLYCTSQNKETIKEELKSVDLTSPLLIYDDYIIYLAFNTYEIQYANDDIKKQIKEVVDDALKVRTEEREDA